MNGMSKWEKRLWLVLAIGSSLGFAFHFGNAALEKLEAIRLIGEQSLVKVEEAGKIVSASQPAVTKAAANSDTLVTQGTTVLARMEALEQRSDRLEAELRTTTQHLETHFITLDERSERMEEAFVEFVTWARNPFASLLERKPKEAKR